jgi:hypothetical protein
VEDTASRFDFPLLCNVLGSGAILSGFPFLVP